MDITRFQIILQFSAVGLIESVNELIDTLDSEVTGEIVEQSDSVILTGSSSMFPGIITR